MSEKLEKLCRGVRAIGPGVEVRFMPSEVLGDQWCVMVTAGPVIVLHTDFGTLEEALDQALSKLTSISTRMMAAVRRSQPPPDSGTKE